MEFPRCDMVPSEEESHCHCIGCPVTCQEEGCVLTLEGVGVYRFEGGTPHGGIRAIFHFTDTEGNLVSKDEAGYVEIREMDEAGGTVHIDYGVVDEYGFSHRKDPRKHYGK